MPTVTLQLSDKPVLTIPAELAQQAGLVEGEVQVVVGEHSIVVLPATSSPSYTTLWESLSTTMREQAAQYQLTSEDRRDAEYWEIVAPLFEETERTTGFI